MVLFCRRLYGFYALAFSALMLTGCGQETNPKEMPPVKVGVVTLKAEVYENTMELPGRTSAYRTAEVRPQVGGIILERLFEEGSLVEANQSLYQIDSATYEAALKSAKATLALAESKEKRYKDLVENQAVSKLEYEQANAALLEAQAKYDMAKIDLEYTKVRAPISGRIGRSRVSEGALVSVNQAAELATIKQLDPIYVDVTQPVRQLLKSRRAHEQGRLQKVSDGSAKVQLTLEEGTEYPLTGALKFNEVNVDEGTASVTLRAIFPNPDENLLPGLFVHARLVGGVDNDAILAPQQGITRNFRGDPVAYVVNADNQVEQRDLDAVQTVGNRWLINSGLQAGDQLITEGLQHIKPGMQVEVQAAANVTLTKTSLE
ncbi:efflux RND transporter periplasmic adaptor subunit [Ketobacter sp. MCCC 1A13808]|uniref:efflux RND transporter periplasmic adaptor subunit n=1 Tax=Ketobacter sp. MCCC 1A13808 TaxID=2602738 RepID=UPI0012ECA103|nr:efflux RND transporter periplasmic adaptor subunit [Ketobacter sp. MCCC 1A13808]MVF11545.1 efflux RND transporter periplasmic adaptor subunit [Ketobacter sp. MCCC 1A13808]